MKYTLSLLLVLGLFTSLSANASTVVDAALAITSALRVGINPGAASADCNVQVLDGTREKVPFIAVNIIKKSTNELSARVLITEEDGSTQFSSSQFGRKVSMKINQNGNTQSFKFSGKKKVVTLGVNDLETSCLLQ